MNNLVLNKSGKTTSISAKEIQDFACKGEALFYSLFIKTQEMVDSKKYLTGESKELFKRHNSETISFLNNISLRCDKLAGELVEQFECLTTKVEKKLALEISENHSKVRYEEVFY